MSDFEYHEDLSPGEMGRVVVGDTIRLPAIPEEGIPAETGRIISISDDFLYVQVPGSFMEDGFYDDGLREVPRDSAWEFIAGREER